MALVHTTLSAACAASDTALVVASATGFSAGYLVRVGDEMMRVTSAYVSGTTIPVVRGQEGTVVAAHAVTTGVVCGIASDWATMPGAQTAVQYPLAGRNRSVVTYGAAGAITLPTAGCDMVAVVNGTSARAMTVAAPGKDLDGSMLWVASDGAAAHTVTFTGGLSGAATGYTTVTINATAPVVVGPFIAVNSLWQAAATIPISGTVTNITAALT